MPVPVGWLPMNNVLLYATAGLAYGRVTQNVGVNVSSNPLKGLRFTVAFLVDLSSTIVFFGNARTATGWIAGAGI
jgi:opacity protein-like surface antigen